MIHTPSPYPYFNTYHYILHKKLTLHDKKNKAPYKFIFLSCKLGKKRIENDYNRMQCVPVCLCAWMPVCLCAWMQCVPICLCAWMPVCMCASMQCVPVCLCARMHVASMYVCQYVCVSYAKGRAAGLNFK